MKHTNHSLSQCQSRGFNPTLVLSVASKIKVDSGIRQIILVCCVNRINDGFNSSDVDCIVIDPVCQNIVTVTGFRVAQLKSKESSTVKIVKLPHPVNIRIH